MSQKDLAWLNPSTFPFFFYYSSGTLQDGFELRNRLDYYEYDKGPESEEIVTRSVPAKLVGTALVRGYKAYLE